jgi:hypothetical protein
MFLFFVAFSFGFRNGRVRASDAWKPTSWIDPQGEFLFFP